MKLKKYLHYNLAIPQLGIYPKEMKTCIYIKTFVQMFIITFSVIAPSWKQPKCLNKKEQSTDTHISMSESQKHVLCERSQI